jgi:hypothetical protein
LPVKAWWRSRIVLGLRGQIGFGCGDSFEGFIEDGDDALLLFRNREFDLLKSNFNSSTFARGIAWRLKRIGRSH